MNYHYNDMSTPPQPCDFATLQQTNSFGCSTNCLDKFNMERSETDQNMLKEFVQGSQAKVSIPWYKLHPVEENFTQAHTKSCTQENYGGRCVCSSRYATERVCQNPAMVEKLYDNGLTEYTNLRSPGWSKVSPGDYDFPVSKGCGWK